MVEVVAMYLMYLCLSFSVLAATVLRVDQDMENFDKLELLTDAEVEALCKVDTKTRGVDCQPQYRRGRSTHADPCPGQCNQYAVGFEFKTCMFLHLSPLLHP